MRRMKDTGVEWIGKIPADWDCCKQKYKIQLINGRAYKDTEFEENGTYRVLRVGNLFSNNNWYTSSLELEEDKYCDNGDLLYAWSMTYGPYIWSGEKVIYHYHIWKTKISSDVNKMFAFYYFSALSDSIKAETHETTMGFITMGNMNNSYIAYPKEIKTQDKIARFLDRKILQIDSIIAKQEQIIEKLKEYKLSIITEVVTKGLDPNVKMKDSGIEWIGKIPIHWTLRKVKNVTTKIGSGKTPKGGADIYSSSGILFLRSQNVYDDGLVLDDPTYITEEIDEEMSNTRVQPHDVLLNITGGSIGRCCVFPETIARANVNQHVSIIRVRKTLCISEYMHYYWNSEKGKTAISVYQTGGNREGMSGEAIGNTPIPIPPMEEQINIVKYISSRVNKIVCDIQKKEKIIEKLQSYKKSLIYEVVTGKKEV